MDTLRQNAQNPLFPVSCQSSRLLGYKSHRITLIQQTQLPGRMAIRLRINKNPSLQQVTVEIRHQRTDIPRRIRTVGLLVPMGFFFGNSFAMSLGIQAMAGLEYQIPDVPVLFYLRVGLGVDLNIGDWPNRNFVDFSGSGALGVMYTF